MQLKEKIEKKQFIITAEIEAPKGISVQKILSDLEKVKAKVDAFNVTDMQASRMRMSSWALCIMLKQINLEPIMQLTARDRNVLALGGDLLAAFSFGVKNLLLLTGDDPSWGDHPKAKSVFEFDSIGLIQLANKLNSGVDWADNKIEGKTSFYSGAALNPFSPNLDKELKKMDAKIKAGASFFQTQPIFEVERFKNFLDKYKPPLPVIAGITLLKSEKMARYLNDNIPGVEVPSVYIEKMKKTGSRRKESVRIAKNILTNLKSLCQGAHFMPFGWFDELGQILVDEH
ncbi:MAG: methylenetetrahydrofolate reductase [Candidatus Omnitrophica bacterium]|nr:methylenetetrahydrofolate reductase [Candidatus Omnitrophota bacterium]MCF7894133.1 methylenetetrahydrofolate reductase [Candidatus Omnitrophota bacterium]